MSAPLTTEKLLYLGLVLLAGCTVGVPVDTPLQSTTPIQTSSRFTVTRVGVFADALAYDGGRGIYVIVDSKTGKEYVEISGIGISETGEHSCGKGQTCSDER